MTLNYCKINYTIFINSSMAYTTIDDPEKYFKPVKYVGNLLQHPVEGFNHQPDWLWFKNADTTNSHNLLDSTRGTTKRLRSDDNSAEATVSTRLDSFDADGFTVETDPAVNGNNNEIVVFSWAANGGTTSSNSDGTITSTVQANTTAGFSIITYTGTGSTATIGHGLNSAPEMIITKGRSDAHSWLVGVTADSSDLSKVLVLQTTAASVTATSNYNAAPNSSTYQVVNAGGTNNNADTYVAYVFHSVQGYSKIGSYTGNGNADGTFVYTGFKPAWVMTKRTDSSDHWRIVDATREPFNDGSMQGLKANTNEAEADAGSRGLDFLSNGFKIRTTDPDSNASGGDYIYMAFAEHPFVSSEGVPTTAR